MPYTYTKKVYKDIPFKCVLRKKGYYNVEGFYTAPSQSMFIYSYFTSYSGLTLDSEQIGSSPLAIKINGGELPVRYSYCSDTIGCLKAAGQNYNVTVPSYNNYATVGSPIINYDTGIVSNCSNNNYLTVAEGFSSSSPYKIMVKFTTGSSFPQYFSIVKSNNKSIIPFYLNYANLGAYASSDGSSWNMFSHHHIADLSANTTYEMMFEFTGSAYIWYQKENGVWNELTRVTSSTQTISPQDFIIGMSDSNDSFGGTFDLSEFKIEVNGDTLWTPLASVEKIYDNFTKVGSIAVDRLSGIVSGFSNSNTVMLPETFDPGNNPWEIQFKVHYVASTGRQRMFNSTIDNRGLMFHTSGSNLVYVISSGSSSWDILFNSNVGGFQLQDNTDYVFKLAFTGTAYTVNVSTNGGAFVEILNHSSSTPMSATGYMLGRSESSSEPFLGTFDLTQTKVKLNNETWWTPAIAMEKPAIGLLPAGVTDDGSAQTWNLFYNDDVFLMSTASQLSGYSWCGSIAVPAHNI